MFFRSKKNSVTDPRLSEIAAITAAFFDLSEASSIVVLEGKPQEYIIKIPFVCKSLHGALIAHLNQESSLSEMSFVIEHNVPIFASNVAHLSNVKNIVAVSSGKGGVGKSATAVNLALALKSQGARVGILDADIYGPSIPLMLGTVNASPASPDNKHMLPIDALGLVSNSIGYLVKNDHASIWRGPMASKALSQLAKETRWPLLDYLIVDMPPGTGDIQLTMAQQLPLTAAVIVTTPQDIALSDAEKGIAMYNKLELPVLGMVENMSYFECPQCHHQTPIFSSHGAHRLSEKYHLPMLAEVPLNTLVREYADNGKSLIDELPEQDISKIYQQAALRMSIQMSETLRVSETVSDMINKIEITQLS
jgi:ATP-binding protein involved in chromosome partitioning